jgi:hypothetical protein
MTTPLCLRCTYLEQEVDESRYEGNRYGLFKRSEPSIDWYCRIQYKYIHKRPKHCIEFQPITQTKFVKDGESMVKLGDIPSEGEKLDLTKLPQELTAIATEEKMQEAAGGKTGGLVITLKTKAGQTFNQKYSKMSGAVLAAALKKLKLEDTLDLQKAWYKYVKTDMRMGFPRMIPTEKVKEA